MIMSHHQSRILFPKQKILCDHLQSNKSKRRRIIPTIWKCNMEEDIKEEAMMLDSHTHFQLCLLPCSSTPRNNLESGHGSCWDLDLWVSNGGSPFITHSQCAFLCPEDKVLNKCLWNKPAVCLMLHYWILPTSTLSRPPIPSTLTRCSCSNFGFSY